jgi:DNA-binding transcriptional ArsR family regulator
MPVALEQPKKPVGGAYGVFLAEKRPEFAKLCVGQPASAVSKMAGAAWGKLSDSQQAPYQKQYESKKAKFDKDMEAFLASGGEKAQIKRKGKEGKKVKDPNAPKKPAGGGYGVFLAKNRAAIVKSLPADHKITDVSKAAGEQWRALSEAAKKPYNAEYLKKMEEYQKELAEYKKNLPEDAEEDEDEDDEEEHEEEEQPAPKKARK